MLKHELGVSVGLINALMRRAVRKGLVKIREAPYKRYAYYLTPQGFAEKGRLVASYLDFSLSLFREARDQYSEIFQDIRARGLAERVVLIGGSELAEIAVLAAVREEVSLFGIVDPRAEDTRRYGIDVVPSLDALGPVDAVIITDLTTPQETYEALQEKLPKGHLFAPKILRITPDRAALLAASGGKGEK